MKSALAFRRRPTSKWRLSIETDTRRQVRYRIYRHTRPIDAANIKDASLLAEICPHDFPFSGWYGYNDAVGTLKNPADATVQPYTIRRIEAFLDWTPQAEELGQGGTLRPNRRHLSRVCERWLTTLAC